MSEVINPTYRLTCLYCGGALYPIASSPDSAPWICVICKHGWWAAELSEESRKKFRPAVVDFGYGKGLADLQLEVLAEREAARSRGTSVRTDQLQLLPLHILQRLPSAEEFGDLLQLEITRKGG